MKATLFLKLGLIISIMCSSCSLKPHAAVLRAAARPDTATAVKSSPAATVIPTPFGGGGHIAFISNRDGNYQIYIMNSDGEDQTRLTYNEADNYFPALSPDGSMVMYWHVDQTASPEKYEMHTIFLNTLADQAWAVNTVGYPSWSPDGTSAIFAGLSSEGIDIYKTDGQTGEFTRLTNDPDQESMLAWSPDGKTIAFVSTREGTSYIYLMPADGGQPRRLAPLLKMMQYDVSWSPDGSRLAFVSGDDLASNIYTIGSNGVSLEQITDDTSYNENPVWSPDGTMIAFWSDRSGDREIYAIGLDGTGLTNLTNSPGEDENPSWSK